MKKTILYLIAGLVILSSCEKEDDILQPIPTNTTTNNTDTLIVNGDTTINNTDTLVINGDTTTTYTPIGGVTIVTDPDNFVGYNNGVYVLTSCELVMTKLSNSPETNMDTSYTYSYNETECNSYAAFGATSGFESFVIPVDKGIRPNHTATWSPTYEKPTTRTVFLGTNCVYTNGILSMDLEYTICGSAGVINNSTSLDVVQYSDESFDLILDIPPTTCSSATNSYTPFTWKSYTKLHFKKQ